MTEGRFFLLCAIPIALILMILSSTHAVGDGGVHFWTCYHLSNRIMGCDESTEWKARSEDVQFYKNAPDDIGISVSGEIFEDFHLFVQDDTEVTMAIRPDHMNYYSILSYLPQVLGLTLGRLMGLSAVLTFFLGRLFALITYIGLCYLAIRKTPVGKLILMGLSLMPFTLTIAGSYSYDMMVYVSVLGFISCMLALRERVSKANVLLAILFAFLLGSVKGGGYLLLLPMVGILFAKEKTEFSRKKQVLLVCGIAGAAGVGIFLADVVWPAGQELFQFGSPGSENVLGASYAFTHPISYVWLVIKTYASETIESIMTFGKTSTGFLNLLLMVIVMLSATQEEDRLTLTRWDKVFCLIPVVLVFLYTPVMLLGFTSTDDSVISGLRARYYLPAMPLLLLLLSKLRLWTRMKPMEEKKKLMLKKACMGIIAGINVIGVVRVM